MAITAAGSTAAPMETRGFATIDDEFVTNMTTVPVPLAAASQCSEGTQPRSLQVRMLYVGRLNNGTQDQS